MKTTVDILRNELGDAMRFTKGTAKAGERRAETFSNLTREYAERRARVKRSGREDLRLLYGSPQKKIGKRPHSPSSIAAAR